MRTTKIVAAIAALLLPTSNARAESPGPMPQIGEEYEISRSYKTSQQTSDGSSSGSSSGRDTILERVIAVRDAGLELEYDLPKDAKVEDRARHWSFPARVLKPISGPMQLLNGRELETRVEGWLKAAGWTRTVCGRWVFTWNAFLIECDPQSVIKMLDAFDLRSADLREGAVYRDAEALGPGALTRGAAGPSGATFTVNMKIDPDTVRRARAESDVAVAEIMRKPVTLDAALRERAKESISGTISVTLDADTAGSTWRRTKVTKLQIKRPDGLSDSQTSTEVTERRLVSKLSAQH